MADHLSKPTKAKAIELYLSLKTQLGNKPTYNEYQKLSGISKMALENLYGSRAYSKLQQECGDEPNEFFSLRTSLDEIMVQYGNLAIEIGDLPKAADWYSKGCHPTKSGLSRPPHNISWSQMPAKFRDWAAGSKEYAKVLEWIPSGKPAPVQSRPNTKLEILLADIRDWSPGRRRNVEETYKVELRNRLAALKYKIKEERGDSNVDLVVNDTFAIETKKEPSLADYDRMFGQIARHLEYHSIVIAVIFDVPRQDQFNDFLLVIDKYFNQDETKVVVVKK